MYATGHVPLFISLEFNRGRAISFALALPACTETTYSHTRLSLLIDCKFLKGRKHILFLFV